MEHSDQVARLVRFRIQHPENSRRIGHIQVGCSFGAKIAGIEVAFCNSRRGRRCW